jgi:hypothetical protein
MKPPKSGRKPLVRPQRERLRRYWKAFAAALAALGLLGALGDRIVNSVWSSASGRINPHKPLIITVRPHETDQFQLALPSTARLDKQLGRVKELAGRGHDGCDALWHAGIGNS